MTVRSLLRIPDKMFHITRRAPGSIPAVGSSRNIVNGLPSNAIPMLNLRLFPPLEQLIPQQFMELKANLRNEYVWVIPDIAHYQSKTDALKGLDSSLPDKIGSRCTTGFDRPVKIF